MSLINQMLRDLDQRRGPAAGADVAALQEFAGREFAGWHDYS